MKIISFAWTSQALLEGKKTVTRRDWKDRFTFLMEEGDRLQAWDKLPRCKGAKKIGELRLTRKPYKQWLHEVTDEDEIKEGGLWGSGKAYQKAMGKDRELWVIEFELLHDRKRSKYDYSRSLSTLRQE